MKDEVTTRISARDTYSRILHEVCAVRDSSLDELDDGWTKLITCGGKRHFVVGYNLGLNNAASSALTNSKTYTYNILSAADVPTALHQVFYCPESQEPYAKDRNSLRYIENFLKLHNDNIVMKPDGGTTGQHVYHVTNSGQIEPAMQQIFSPNYWHDMCYAGAMSPYYEIQHEYRMIMLDGEPKFAYQKSLTPESDWKFNLSQGAVAAKVTSSDLSTELADLAKSAMAALALRFASVDMIRLTSGELLVLEVNSGVSVNGYLKQHPEDYDEFKGIFAEVMDKIFALE